MHRRLLTVTVLLYTSTLPSLGQVGNAVIGVGYSAPVPVRVAPGQIITVFVQGSDLGLTQEWRAQSTPLPTNLGGFSVALRQTTSNAPIQVPLLAVRPVTSCPGAFATECATAIAITLQVPFELNPNNPLSAAPGSSPISNQAVLIVSANAVNGYPLGLTPDPDRIHVLTTCDSVAPSGNLCSALVAHSDGRLVTAATPARGGETLVMYAYGLGATQQPVRSGERSPNEPRPAVGRIDIGFELAVNAPPRRPVAIDGGLTAAPRPIPPGPAYAGLTPGYVGLYQINFVVPGLPAGHRPCDGQIQSNLTVSIGGLTSFDGGAICVEVASPVVATAATTGIADESTSPPPGSFMPNYIAYPVGADLRHLAMPVPPQSVGLPPEHTRGVLPSKP